MNSTLLKPKWLEKIQCVCFIYRLIKVGPYTVCSLSICRRSNAMGLDSHTRLKKLKHVFECKNYVLYCIFVYKY